MNILEQINEKAIKHKVNTGKKPTRIYLGENEYDRIRAEAVKRDPFARSCRVAKYDGMDIHRTKDLSHCEVGA